MLTPAVSARVHRSVPGAALDGAASDQKFLLQPCAAVRAHIDFFSSAIEPTNDVRTFASWLPHPFDLISISTTISIDVEFFAMQLCTRIAAFLLPRTRYPCTTVGLSCAFSARALFFEQATHVPVVGVAALVAPTLLFSFRRYLDGCIGCTLPPCCVSFSLSRCQCTREMHETWTALWLQTTPCKRDELASIVEECVQTRAHCGCTQISTVEVETRRRGRRKRNKERVSSPSLHPRPHNLSSQILV